MARPPRPIGSTSDVWVATRENDSGTVYVAMCKVRDPDGRTRTVTRSGDTARMAKRRLQEHLQQRVAGQHGALSPATRLEAVVELWRAQLAREVRDLEMSPTTLGTYDSAMNTHILPALGQLTLMEITVVRLDLFLGQLADAGVEPTSVRGVRTALSGALSFAVRRGAIPTNPMRDTQPIRVRRKGARALAVGEEQQLLARVDAHPKAVRYDFPDLLRLMLATGCRIGEAMALTWENVDLGGADRPASLLVNGTIIREPGVGLVRKGTKSAAGEREMELPDWARDMLTRRFLVRFGVSDALDGMYGPVFPHRSGGWRDPARVLHDWAKVRVDVGFDDLNLHRLRKTMATRLDDAGVPARVVSDRMGHSRVSMTQDNYLERGGEAGRRLAAEALQHRGG